MNYIIHSDGGARGNPGPAGAGAVIYSTDKTLVASVSEFLGHKTNNFAEYEAIILAFEELKKIVSKDEKQSITIFVNMDSELIVKQMLGIYKVKNPVLKQQQSRLKKLIIEYQEVLFSHIPRAENKEADALANKAMDNGF